MALHGNSNEVYLYGRKVDEKILANIIRNRRDYNGEEIVLICCNFGNTDVSENCFAQRIANEKKVIHAPTRYGAISQNGIYYSSDITGYIKEGTFKSFCPKES